MQVTLDITIDDVYYGKAEPENGIQEQFEVEVISFIFDGIKITSLTDLYEMIINNYQKELVRQYLTELNPNYIIKG